MNFLKKNKKTFVVNEEEVSFRIQYLGNVLTSMTKGEGCVDRPVNMLWNNFLKVPERRGERRREREKERERERERERQRERERGRGRESRKRQPPADENKSE